MTILSQNRARPVRRIVHYSRRSTEAALAIVVGIAHLTIIFLYFIGRDASVLVFNSDSVRQFIQGPVVPAAHAVAAVLLFSAVRYRGLRQWATSVAAAVWAGYTVALYVAADNHTPPASLVGAGIAFGVFLICVILVAAWGAEDEDGD